MVLQMVLTWYFLAKVLYRIQPINNMNTLEFNQDMCILSAVAFSLVFFMDYLY